MSKKGLYASLNTLAYCGMLEGGGRIPTLRQLQFCGSAIFAWLLLVCSHKMRKMDEFDYVGDMTDQTRVVLHISFIYTTFPSRDSSIHRVPELYIRGIFLVLCFSLPHDNLGYANTHIVNFSGCPFVGMSPTPSPES